MDTSKQYSDSQIDGAESQVQGQVQDQVEIVTEDVEVSTEEIYSTTECCPSCKASWPFYVLFVVGIFCAIMGILGITF